MSDMALPGSIEPAARKGPNLDSGFHPLTGIIYMGVVAAALLFVVYRGAGQTSSFLRLPEYTWVSAADQVRTAV